MDSFIADLTSDISRKLARFIALTSERVEIKSQIYAIEEGLAPILKYNNELAEQDHILKAERDFLDAEYDRIHDCLESANNAREPHVKLALEQAVQGIEEDHERLNAEGEAFRKEVQVVLAMGTKLSASMREQSAKFDIMADQWLSAANDLAQTIHVLDDAKRIAVRDLLIERGERPAADEFWKLCGEHHHCKDCKH
ncbi:unnamed protein product [Peniophora sp. CBMAI 1063]|nr:unnamed protein product [Peniophora sp. CBMAI 1063]